VSLVYLAIDMMDAERGELAVELLESDQHHPCLRCGTSDSISLESHALAWA